MGSLFCFPTIGGGEGKAMEGGARAFAFGVFGERGKPFLTTLSGRTGEVQSYSLTLVAEENWGTVVTKALSPRKLPLAREVLCFRR
jgi:hypothetical protein